MSQPDLTLDQLMGKTAVIGLSYFDTAENLMSQRQLAGQVIKVTPDDGITLQLLGDGAADFIIPSDLSPWFIAPEGRFFDKTSAMEIVNPDYLVTWNVHQTQSENIEDKTHQWWDWVPCVVAPQVGSPQ